MYSAAVLYPERRSTVFALCRGLNKAVCECVRVCTFICLHCVTKEEEKKKTTVCEIGNQCLL